MSNYPQAPGPYGQPGGYVGQAWSGGPVPPAPGKRPKGFRRIVVVLSVVVALVAAAGVGVWLWQTSDGSGGDGEGIAAQADAQLSVVFDDRFPEDWKPDGDEIEYTVGSWVDGRWWTDEHLVREMPGEVVAYNLTDGAVAWRVPVPGNGACLASREVSSEGYVAVLRGDGFGSKAAKGCHQLTLVDIKSGKEVWTKELEPAGGKFPAVADRPVIAGGFVHLSSDRGSRSLSLEDGSPLGGETRQDGCMVTDHVGVDDVLVAWRDHCAVADGNPSDRVLVGFGQDLKMRWAWHFPEDEKKVELEAVLSADPLVVVVRARSAHEVWRVEPGNGDKNDPGKHDVLATAGADFRLSCGQADHSRKLGECPQAVVDDDVLHLQSILDNSGVRTVMGIVAFDIDSGKELWHAKADGDGSLAPLGTDDEGRLIAYRTQSDDSRATVVAVDPANGNLAPLAALPRIDDNTRAQFLLENTDLIDGVEWHDGRLAILAPTVIVTKEGDGGGPGSFASVVYV